MRINPNITADLLGALSNAEQEQDTAMLQMASGRRVNKPSDDPTAAAMLVENSSQSSQADQFLRSIDSLQAQLQSTDSTLNSVVLALQQAISLGVQGANGTLSDANLASLANEAIGIQSQLVSLANFSFQGQHVFSGTVAGRAPYVIDASQRAGVRYDGNTGVNRVQVGEGLSIQVNLPGSQIFSAPGGDVFQSVQDLITALRVFYGNVMNQLTSQQTYLNNQKLQLSSQQDTLGGADLAEAATRLLNAQNARTAALEATGRIWQSTLFDYLK